jgi:hypothetical protein
MNERQYRQVLSNRARRSAALYSGGAADGMLRAAARDVKRKNAAAEVWQALAAPEWAGQAAVVSMRDGTLIVEVPSAVLRERIRRQAGTLTRQLKDRVPGMVALRIAAPNEDAGPREEVD